MKWPKLIPVVEITTRPPVFRRKRDALPENELDTPHSIEATPPRKRRRKGSFEHIVIPQSPTLTDYGYEEFGSNPVAPSPSISELALPNDSSTAYQSADEISQTRVTRSAKARAAATIHSTAASSSKTTLDNLSSASGRPSGKTRARMKSNASISSSNAQDADPIPPFDFSEPDPCSYEPQDDELLESEDIAIPGETTATEVALLDDEVPIRLLRNFAIYDEETSTMVPTGALTVLAFSADAAHFVASGDVSAWPTTLFDEDLDESSRPSTPSSDDDEFDEPRARREHGQRIKLSKILELNIHDWSPDDWQIDRKIYLRTKYAWYILDAPSDEYRPFFLGFWLKHTILNIFATSAINSPRIGYRTFIKSLKNDNIDLGQQLGVISMLGRRLAQSDVEADDTKAYLMVTLPEFCQQNELDLSEALLIHDYFGQDMVEEFVIEVSTARKRSKKKRPTAPKRLRNKEYDVLKHRTQTVVTPTVSRIAKNLFKGSLEVAGAASFTSVDTGVAAAIEEADHTHYSDPKSLKWGPATEDGKWFTLVIVDGVTYKIGDDVMVVPGSDDNNVRVKNDSQEFSRSVNSYANRLWFCKICYFYEKKVKGVLTKMFHGQWFLHGSKTVLQETSHSRAVYLTYTCDDDLPVASIFKKCHISILGPGDPEPVDDARPDANEFHCSLVYDEEKAEFVDLLSQDAITNLLDIPDIEDRPPCIACAVNNRDVQQRVPIPLKNKKGFAYCGIQYHQYDFIYLCPTTSVGVFEVAQILDFPRADWMKVQVYGRWDDFREKWGLEEKADERRLYLANDGIIEIDHRRLNGLCHVLQLIKQESIETWVSHDHHFYVNSVEITEGVLSAMKKGSLLYCKPCGEARTQELKHRDDLLHEHGPLVGLELFSGAGGLSTGLEMSGFVKTKYAVEFSPSAALTHHTNHPETTVYCQDTSNLLKHAIETAEGQNPPPILSYADGKTQLPPMPRRGEVDFIYGGPPCQSFSRANHNKKADDIRSTLPGNMLSYVEHYGPNYFLLENVAGILDYPLMSTTDGRMLKGGIKGGVVKFIVRTLIALGYQVRFRLMQAGSYGTPQSRRRVIFFGAKRGVKLPEHPLPMYAFPRGMHKTTLPTGQKIPPLSRSLNPDDPHQCAPLHPWTVDDSISDLPPFDWQNPHLIIPAKPKDRQATQVREADGILQLHAINDRAGRSAGPVGFPDGAEYWREPQNRYQACLREGNGDIVECHYTKRFKPRTVEATTTVPLEGGKCHRDLPLVLQPQHAKPGQKQSKFAFYGRMRANEQFKCALTSGLPNQKGTWLLHPTQRRIITVREMARSQGFPDSYVFKSVNTDMSRMIEDQTRQIGNAVPIYLALALGKSIGDAILEEWEKEEQTQMERDRSPTV